MSFRIPFAEVDAATKTLVADRCTIRGKRDEFTPVPPVHYCFRVDEKAREIAVPLGLWRELGAPQPEEKYAPAALAFSGALYTRETDPLGYRDQDAVAAAALAKLEDARAVFLALNTGFGKTRCAIFLACALQLKTLVLCHFHEVNKQWRAAFEKLGGATPQLLSDAAAVDPAADVYISGVQKLQNLLRRDPDAFRSVGLVIVDEAHRSTAAIAEKCLTRLFPRYLIGLTATPDRSDTLDRMYAPYFGPAAGHIVRAHVKAFTVVKVCTPYKPELSYRASRGRTSLDWTAVQNSLAYNTHRNRDVARLILENPEHTVLVLGVRVAQAAEIHKFLREVGVDATLFVGATKRYADTRVLVTTAQKSGVGFNDERFTMLVLLADVKDVRQLEGRIRTVNNVIFDFVDTNKTLEKHWLLRKKWYKTRGATFRTVQRGARDAEDAEEHAKTRDPPSFLGGRARAADAHY